MCTQCDDAHHTEGPPTHGRRAFLKAGVGLASASLLAGVPTSANAAPKGTRAAQGPLPAKALGATDATSALAPMSIQRRAVGPNDVLLDVRLPSMRNHWEPDSSPSRAWRARASGESCGFRRLSGAVQTGDAHHARVVK